MQFDLIELMKNRLVTLANNRAASYETGDVVNVLALDEEIAKTQTIIAKLSA